MKAFSFAIVFAILAWIVSLNMARARESVAYGFGAEKCSVALTHNWMSGGEGAFVGGYMSAVADFESPLGDMLPGGSTTALVAIVYKQCKAEPDIILSAAAGKIAARIIAKQVSAQAPPSDQNRQLEGNPL